MISNGFTYNKNSFIPQPSANGSFTHVQTINDESRYECKENKILRQLVI